MNNPLSEIQIKELNEIAKLSPSDQKNRLKDFLARLAPEQISFLQSQQEMKSCPFCDIVSGKLESRKIYEDEQVLAILDINPSNKGHILLMPKKHYVVLAQMSDNELSYLFKIANHLSKKVFELLKVEGTNIFVANGRAAGQVVPHILIHIIPRTEGDGINLNWVPKQYTLEEMSLITAILVKGCEDIKFDFEQSAIKKQIIENTIPKQKKSEEKKEYSEIKKLKVEPKVP